MKLRIYEGSDNLNNLDLYLVKSQARSFVSQGLSFDDVEQKLQDEGKSEDFIDAVIDKMKKYENMKFSYRIDYYGSWDNGRVLHSFKKGTLYEAERDAKNKSLKDRDNLYYVVIDDIMDPTTGWSWYQGTGYSDGDPTLNRIKREINNRG